MFKKITIFLILFSLIGFYEPSSALFFKRHKAKKQTVEQTPKKNEGKKILLVQIYASWCPGCKNIQPTLDQLLKETTDIELIQLDVSTPSKAKASAKQAEELKVADFYNANKSKTATVAVIIPTSTEIVTVFQNNNELNDYKTAIQEAKTKEQALKNPPT